MIKKIFRRDKKTKTPKPTDSVNSLEISSSRLSEISKERLLPDEEQGDDVSDSASMKVLGASTGSRECSSSESLNYGQLSEEARETKAEYKKTARKLNVAMQKLRRKEAKIKRRQRDIICMQRELCELTRLMHIANTQALSLDLAIDQTRMEMASLCSQIESSSEEDVIRKREPLCYKKLKNASTKGDIEKALSMIRGRQEALKHLEVLAYRKLLMHSNSLTNTSHQTSVSFGKDRKSADNFLVSFRNNRHVRVRPVPPPKPVVSSPTVRMNTHLQSAQNLLNELIQISVTGAANTAPTTPQQSDV